MRPISISSKSKNGYELGVIPLRWTRVGVRLRAKRPQNANKAVLFPRGLQRFCSQRYSDDQPSRTLAQTSETAGAQHRPRLWVLALGAGEISEDAFALAEPARPLLDHRQLVADGRSMSAQGRKPLKRKASFRS